MNAIVNSNWIRCFAGTFLVLILGVLPAAVVRGDDAMTVKDYRSRLAQDEIVYFLLPDRFENGDTSNDRGGLSGGKLETGFDPTDKAFYRVRADLP